MKPHLQFSKLSFVAIIFVVALLLVSCGSSNNSPTSDEASSASADASNAEQPAMATMPAARFTAVAQTSEMVTNTTTLTQTQAVEAGAADLERGALSYEKNKCGDCHGAQGEGVEGKGKAIAGTMLTLEEFDTILRTGSGLGNSHIFGRSAVSPAGMEALYAYVQSLQP
jgi:mono/diheme cytochrome c family protein